MNFPSSYPVSLYLNRISYNSDLIHVSADEPGRPQYRRACQSSSLPAALFFKSSFSLMIVQQSKSIKKAHSRRISYYALQRSICLAMCKHCPKMIRRLACEPVTRFIQFLKVLLRINYFKELFI